MFYVLIVMITLGGLSQGIVINTQEFTTKENCEEAAKLIQKDSTKKDGSFRKNIKAVCLPK